ncbi:MAG: hypothetical protein ACLQVJ_02855 [Syntrophobacteraceae bacterium]
MEDFDVTLEILKQSYANEQDNPLHVWEAILYCLTEKTEEVPMPPWVKVYLEEVAEDLLAIKKVLKKGGEELKNALKISDLRVFANHVGAREKKLIFQKVNHEMQKSDRPDVLTVFSDVAKKFKPISEARNKTQYSEEKIKDTYYELKKIYDEQAAEDQKQETILWKEDQDRSNPPKE